jgi:hypothetical protein
MNMKSTFLALPALLLGGGFASAELLVHESFTYPNGDLTGSGGSGWTGAWTGTNPVVVTSPGLTFSDAIGNSLVTSGSALNTADGGAVTTISSREVADRNAETWISVLVQPQGTSADFVGVSFYDNGLATADARFAIEHAGGKDLRLTRRAGALIHTASFSTTIGAPVLAVIHLVPGGGGGDPALDRLDVFFNPVLDSEPPVPHASISIDGLQYDRIRIAAQNGRSALVDELRIGETYADVTPFVPATDPDHDGDGLTDSQEEELGLDPLFPDTQFIAALKANPDLFGLRSTDEIFDVRLRGPTVTTFGPGSANYSLDLIRKNGTILDSISEPIPSPPSRLFLRLYLATP